ncbi:hypothetical protein OHB26_10335 [Nocardia sp. NBC_01503]|uniref:hypothetical protein n=1 Tax=Nocardia sp. NBC_01503 TaxID=2975997 RepID=UPI002E7B53FB|nr:hypothetical protein [Nocardia sp. NBC_01503]WTL34553.1 hypothetical protein OHB26_10335 [Nocardia sp. NBC_01503]
MTTTAPTLNPAIIGQAEKHHTAILARALTGTTLDERQWITLNQALAAGVAVPRVAHIARVAGMTRWEPNEVERAAAALIEKGLLAMLPGDEVQINAAGREMVARVRAASGKILDPAYGVVSQEELEIAARVLTAITARMSEELARA